MTKASTSAKIDLPGHVDHGLIESLLGYHLAQASIPTNSVFKKNIADVFEVNKLEFTILMLLNANPGMTPKRLATAINIPAPNLTLILTKLEGRGLLSRNRSESDRRVSHLMLRRKGVEQVSRMSAVVKTMEGTLTQHLTAAEKAMLFELLKKIASHRKI